MYCDPILSSDSVSSTESDEDRDWRQETTSCVHTFSDPFSLHLLPTFRGVNNVKKKRPSTRDPPTAKNKTSLKYQFPVTKLFESAGMKCCSCMTITASPLDTLSVKLMAPYTNAEDSTLLLISSAVRDRVVISTADPAAPNNTAAKNIPYCLKKSCLACSSPP